jgi:hypothetical protein
MWGGGGRYFLMKKWPEGEAKHFRAEVKEPSKIKPVPALH